MTDAIPGPSCAEVVKLIQSIPLTAHEISALLRCSLKQTLAALSCCWWEIVPTAWDGPGWRYAARQTLSQKLAKPADTTRHYANSRIAYPSAYT